MTRSDHILEIFDEIGQHAGFTVLEQYEETEQVGFDDTCYSFIVTESEESWYENGLGFIMTSMVMMYIDFRLDDFGENFTLKKNEIIQKIETARVQANLTLDRTDTIFHYSTSVPMMRSISGTMDTNNSKGIVDILFEVKTLVSPK